MLVSEVHKPLSFDQSQWNADRLRINNFFASATTAADVWFLCGFCKPSLQLPVFLSSFNQSALVWCSEPQLCRACIEEEYLFTKLWQARLLPLHPRTTVLNTFLEEFLFNELWNIAKIIMKECGKFVLIAILTGAAMSKDLVPVARQ